MIYPLIVCVKTCCNLPAPRVQCQIQERSADKTGTILASLFAAKPLLIITIPLCCHITGSFSGGFVFVATKM